MIRATRPKENKTKYSKDRTVYLPYTEDVTDQIGKNLTKKKISTVYMPTKNIGEYLKAAKDCTILQNYMHLWKSVYSTNK